MEILQHAGLTVELLAMYSATTSPRTLSDAQTLDMWAIRVAAWQMTLPDLHAPVYSIPQYVNCGQYRAGSHILRDLYVRAFVIWVSPEPMPFSVYQQLARQQQVIDEIDAEIIEEVELNDWIQDMRGRAIVATVRATGVAWQDRDRTRPTLVCL